MVCIYHIFGWLFITQLHKVAHFYEEDCRQVFFCPQHVRESKTGIAFEMHVSARLLGCTNSFEVNLHYIYIFAAFHWCITYWLFPSSKSHKTWLHLIHFMTRISYFCKKKKKVCRCNHTSPIDVILPSCMYMCWLTYSHHNWKCFLIVLRMPKSSK